MRELSEYSFKDLVRDMGNFGTSYQIKTVNAGGILDSPRLDKDTYIVIGETSTVKSSISLPELKIGMSIHGIDENTVVVYFEYRNTFNKKSKKFGVSNTQFQDEYRQLFDEIGCSGAFHMIESTKRGCGVTVRRCYWNVLADILLNVYEKILSKVALTAYDMYGNKVVDDTDIDDEFAFHELDGL